MFIKVDFLQSHDDTFGPNLPPTKENDDLRREVLVANKDSDNESPVPTDEEQSSSEVVEKIKITRKVKNERKCLVDTENNQIVDKRSEKDILEDKLKQVKIFIQYNAGSN